jgi:putative DNA primase/helicase
MCGGTDRFRFSNRHNDGDYICNRCGAGKGIKLVALVNGVDYPTAAQRIDEHLKA